jgi:hypothetical protein
MAEDTWVLMENPPKSPFIRGTFTKIFEGFEEIVGAIGENLRFSDALRGSQGVGGFCRDF